MNEHVYHVLWIVANAIDIHQIEYNKHPVLTWLHLLTTPVVSLGCFDMLVQLFFSYIYRCRGELEVHLASHRYADGASLLHMAAMFLGVESTGTGTFRMFSSVFQWGWLGTQWIGLRENLNRKP